MIEGISTRRVESTPISNPASGLASRQQQEQRGEKQPGAAFAGISDTLTLSPEAREAVSKLQQRDREVRSHEQAHISAGGPHVSGGASYSYSRGPDGKQYAIGGSVAIDTSTVSGDPEATQEKARMVRSAALAPGSPSAQDQSVAAQAASMEVQAQTEKRTQEQESGTSANGQGQGQGQPGATPIRPVNAPDTIDDANAADSTDAAPAAAPRRTYTSPANSGPLAPWTQRSQNSSSTTGTLFGAMENQARLDKVAALYQNQQDRFTPVTQLAPNGTGISIRV